MNFKQNESAVKLRGGYYTSPEIARFLLRWVLVHEPKSILEPSCGDGAFFRSLADLKPQSLETLMGFEIEACEAAKAKDAAAALQNVDTIILPQDFLGWTLSNLLMPQMFDAVVGNPPFIRYQYLDQKLQQVSQELFKHFHLNFTRHTNAWVAFLIASLALLKPCGRLAMVIPSELLHILYAEPLRIHLAQTCSRILLIDPQELWFKDTLQGALLILAEKKVTPDAKSYGVSIVQVRDRSFLLQNPEDCFQSASYANGETVNGKWMMGFLTEKERELLREASHQPQIYSFDKIAEVSVGIVTGANKYFLVTDQIVEEYGLSKWAYPMFGRSEHVPGIVYDESVLSQNRKKGQPTNFIWFKHEHLDDLPPSVRRYVEFGEEQNLHKRYKCRIRTPWYSVPSVYATSVAMLKRSHDFPRLIFNQLEGFTTDTAYRIKVKKFDAPSLVYSFVNSLTALTAELEGRHYGGGVLELVPSEIRRLLVPLSQTNEAEIYLLDNLIRSSAAPEEVLARQDQQVLGKIGIDSDRAQTLREAWMRLKLRRQRRQEASEDDELDDGD